MTRLLTTAQLDAGIARAAALDGIAPALRGGAMAVGGIAPALRGGAMAVGGIAPALRGGAMAVLLCMAGTGCELFSDLDRFEQDDEPAGGDGGGERDAGSDAGAPADDLGCSNPRTLCLRLEGFSPHTDELVSVDLVTVADNILRARAVIEPMGAVTADFVLPLAIPENEVPDPGDDHPLHIEIFADQNKDGVYSPMADPEADHEWNLDLPEDGKLVFQHNTEFTSISPRPRGIGGDFRMTFMNMGPHMGQLLEVMVIENASGRTVGLYRNPSLDEANFEVVIPGIIDVDGSVYRIEFYADFNGNGSYDDPDIDHTWIKEFEESDANGLETSFTHGTDFARLDYQFDFEP